MQTSKFMFISAKTLTLGHHTEMSSSAFPKPILSLSQMVLMWEVKVITVAVGMPDAVDMETNWKHKVTPDSMT